MNRPGLADLYLEVLFADFLHDSVQYTQLLAYLLQYVTASRVFAQLAGGSSELVIGSFRVLGSTDWTTLDAEIGRIFEVCLHFCETGEAW